MHITLMFSFIADETSSGNWFAEFNVRTLNVAINEDFMHTRSLFWGFDPVVLESLAPAQCAGIVDTAVRAPSLLLQSAMN